MDEFIEKHNLQDTLAYVDNVIIGGNTQAEHDSNLQQFQDAAKVDNWDIQQ